jgi:hypothetical protein
LRWIKQCRVQIHTNSIIGCHSETVSRRIYPTAQAFQVQSREFFAARGTQWQAPADHPRRGRVLQGPARGASAATGVGMAFAESFAMANFPATSRAGP